MKVVHIIPTGLERDRIIHLLKKFPANKVYFIRNNNEPPSDKEQTNEINKLIKKFEKLTPLAEHKTAYVDYTDFKEPFVEILNIMKKEKTKGNEVIMHIEAGSRIVAFGAWIAASLTDSRVYYVHAAHYSPKGEKILTKGVVGDYEVFKFPVTLPNQIEGEVLKLLEKKKGTYSLEELVKKIGVKNIGEIKSIQSGIVKMSYCLRELEAKGYITSETVSRKKQKLKLTESGEIMAKAVEILRN